MDNKYLLVSDRNVYTDIKIHWWYTLFCFSHLHQMADFTPQYPIPHQQEQNKSQNYPPHHLTVILMAPNYYTALLPSWLIANWIWDCRCIIYSIITHHLCILAISYFLGCFLNWKKKHSAIYDNYLYQQGNNRIHSNRQWRKTKSCFVANVCFTKTG